MANYGNGTGAGKMLNMGGKRYYMHRSLAEAGGVPGDVYRKSLDLLREHDAEFAGKFNCICWNPGKGTVRFDYSADFDTSTEPEVTEYATVSYVDGSITYGGSPAVWHNKNLWVGDDYTGFDRSTGDEWRNQYMDAIQSNPKYGKFPNGGSRKAWLSHLMSLDKDNGNSGLIDRYVELNDISNPVEYLKGLDSTSGKNYNLATQYMNLHKSTGIEESIARIVREVISEMKFDKRFKSVDDPSKFPDDSEWDGDAEEPGDRQEIGSADTSLKQVPRTFKPSSGITYERGSVNFDIGGGRHDDGTQYMANGDMKFKGHGAINVVFDPYNRTPEFNNKALDYIERNGGADSVTVNSCLNVIKGRKFIENVIQQAAVCLKPGGYAVFQIYRGNASGVGAVSPKGYQQHKRASKYIPLILQFFEKAWLDNGNDCIIAQGPLVSAEDVDFFPDKDGEPRRLRFK